MVHEDKRHSYQEGDHVKFVEVEGMPMINNREPIEIINVKGPFAFQINLDTREWPAYTRQGLVENVKVTKYIKYDAFEKSYKNPVASSASGMLETPDLRFWGRSDHLHRALWAIHEFHSQNGQYPSFEQREDVGKLAADKNDKLKAANDENQPHLDELDLEVVKKAAAFAKCSIVPQAAFFGGIIA